MINLEDEILEKANELYNLLSKYKEDSLETGQYWNVSDAQIVLGRLMRGLEN